MNGPGDFSWQFQSLLMYLVMAPSRDGRCQILVDHEVETKVSGSCGGSTASSPLGQVSCLSSYDL